MDFGEAVRQFYGNYTNAEGRAQRAAYWWVLLYRAIIITVLIIVLLMADGGKAFCDSILEFLETRETTTILWKDLDGSGKTAAICFVGFRFVNLLPDIMLHIRRFHDLGQSGWYVLLFQIVGALQPIGLFAILFNFVWFMKPGTAGSNQYGEDPLEQNLDIFG